MTDRDGVAGWLGFHVPVIDGQSSELTWRRRRAESIARMIAYERLNLDKPGRLTILRPIIARGVFAVGWPKSRWLKRRVREEMARIIADRRPGA
jgi:hypothetical protein